ncbi:SgcJ/EcaC family oxidoreductase [Mumia zhuanghuii]|uniref:SgcJ/EcaC family oxidoreductase n=2 Tax=Mumia TaxID=1546255 RepID=A0ABW1QH52_9ACTN|nr:MULTISPECIES: SgcJ/EcaC family oxidoreductase [Mumia]KAA1422820.1 SgcJ/EcaC family oxidoreductase [Mumia zhuanghuii]
MTTTATDPETRPREIKALTAVVADLERAQNTENVDAFVALFREDAIWTTGHGRLLVGRDAIAAFTRTVLPGAMAETVGSYEVVHVLFLRPDVAAVKVRQRVVRRDGAPTDDAYEGSPLYVMTKDDGRWMLAANQNTVVVDG